MGTNNLETKSPGDTIVDDDPNQYKTAFTENVVPRNSSGVPTTLAGSLGTSSLEFLKAFIASGHWSPGDIKAHHSYNGTVGPGQGWMLCDGRQITEANYNTEHGAGSWDTYVGTSLLENKYLPDLTGDKYLTGVSATTQDGSIAITEVGNASNQIDFSHTHTQPSHNHQWYNRNNSADDESYNSGGSATAVTKNSTTNEIGIVVNDNAQDSPADSYTSNAGGDTTGSSLSATQDIKPRSVEVQFYMRVI